MRHDFDAGSCVGAGPTNRESTVLREFKAFVSKGNIVDLAVAVVIGVAFGLMVQSFVDDILLQVVAAIVGEPSFNGLSFDLGDAEIRYGSFLTVLVSFLSVAFAVFLVVKATQKVQKPVAAPAGPSEIDLLTEIRDSLKK